jgi:hypothetical protein
MTGGGEGMADDVSTGSWVKQRPTRLLMAALVEAWDVAAEARCEVERLRAALAKARRVKRRVKKVANVVVPFRPGGAA